MSLYLGEAGPKNVAFKRAKNKGRYSHLLFKLDYVFFALISEVERIFKSLYLSVAFKWICTWMMIFVGVHNTLAVWDIYMCIVFLERLRFPQHQTHCTAPVHLLVFGSASPNQIPKSNEASWAKWWQISGL